MNTINKNQEALDNLYDEAMISSAEEDLINTCKNKIQKIIDKTFPMSVKWEDIGYDNYRDANVYGCICPRCNLILMSATDIDIDVKDPNPKDIRKAFLDVFSPNGNKQGLNNYCNRCGQKLSYKLNKKYNIKE